MRNSYIIDCSCIPSFHEINSHEINFHEINLQRDQLSRDQLVTRSTLFFMKKYCISTHLQFDIMASRNYWGRILLFHKTKHPKNWVDLVASWSRKSWSRDKLISWELIWWRMAI